MILYRLTQDHDGLPEGACITEGKFRKVYYLDRALFEPVSEFEKKDFIEYDNSEYCRGIGVECILFYNVFELQKFLDKELENGFTD